MNSPLQSRLISPNLQWSGPGSGWVPSLLLNYPRDPWPSPVSLSCLLATRSKAVLKAQTRFSTLGNIYSTILAWLWSYKMDTPKDIGSRGFSRLILSHIIYIILLRYIRVFWETPVRHLSNTLNVASHLRVLLVLFGLRHLLRLSDLFSDSLLRYLGKISAKASDWELSGIGQ